MNVEFRKARPVWEAGKDTEMNGTMGFRTVFRCERLPASASLLVATSGLYRCFVNGDLVGHGPARGPHGHYRMDEWELTRKLIPGDNVIAVEVVGYNVNSYYLLNQPSFLQAEVVADESIVAYTSADADEGCFPGAPLPERVQRVQRYSFQRTFVEYYRLNADGARWRTGSDAGFAAASFTEAPAKALLPRGVPYPELQLRAPMALEAAGRFRSEGRSESYWRDRSLTGIGPDFAGFPLEELELIISDELIETISTEREDLKRPYVEEESLTLREGDFALYDYGVNLTGMAGIKLRVTERAKLYLVFDEILTGGDIDFLRLGCVNAVGWELEPGEYDLETIEPYTMRYAKLMLMSGDAEVRAISLRELVNPDTKAAEYRCDREALNAVFRAGVESFRQNATDVYMDCPSRERAGWLCDSFFTSRVEYALTGGTRVETNFLENYRLPKRFAHLPEGMLPMCYPADHDDGVFIPNWALWFVLELEEYATRSSGGTAAAAGFLDKIERLFAYFRPFENEDGLLEDLESWVFLEWSKANDFVRGVNYPSNMLYAAALSAAGRLYGRHDWLGQAERIRETIRRQSYDGTFFVDQALREDGRLVIGRDRTEACQYYAFTFDVATPESYPELWRVMSESFGPDRGETERYPDIHPANAFVGNYLRLDLLSRYGKGDQTLREMEDYFHYMAEKTGTLWEHASSSASCNHGFASHAVHWLYRDGLGIRHIDHANKTIEIRIDPSRLAWCEGSIPAGDGVICFSWRRETNDRILYSVGKEHDYRVNLSPVDGYVLVEQ